MGNNAKLELSQFLLGPPNESTLRRGGSVSHGPGRVWGLKVIHGARISDPTNGHSLVQMDFHGGKIEHIIIPFLGFMPKKRNTKTLPYKKLRPRSGNKKTRHKAKKVGFLPCFFFSLLHSLRGPRPKVFGHVSTKGPKKHHPKKILYVLSIY